MTIPEGPTPTVRQLAADAARRSRWLPGGRLEVLTYVGGTRGDRTVLDPP
jgi:hypothetical protein